MRISGRVVALAVVFSIALSGVALACHSNFFNEVFTKLDHQKVTSDQLEQLMKLKRGYILADHRANRCDAAHDQHQPEFLAAAAGVLNDEQYEAISGKPKTEIQSLRYDVKQLRKEVAEIKKLLLEFKSQK